MSTGILPQVIGNVVTTEDKTSIQINCEPQINLLSSQGSKSFDNVKYSVVAPFNSEEIVPASGGAVVKVIPNTNTYNFIADENYTARKDRIDKIISNELKDISKDNISFSNYKNISDVKLKINKALYDAAKQLRSNKNFYETPGVPEFTFGSLYYEYNKIGQLDSDIKNSITQSNRIDNLKKIGVFQFIPFETILSAFRLLSKVKLDGDKKIGIGTFKGLTGFSFESIFNNLEKIQKWTITDQASVDNILAAALIELFPLYRIEEDYLESGSDDDDQNRLLGFYTFFNSNFYVKTPDFSGRDYNDQISNFNYQFEQEPNKILLYLLEIYLKNNDNFEYSVLPFKYQQLPSLEIQDGNLNYPNQQGLISNSVLELSGVIENYDSIDYINKTKISKFNFYLSPIVNNKSKKIRGIKDLNMDKIEVSTIPLDLRLKDTVDKNNLFGTVPLHLNNGQALDSVISSINRPELVISNREDPKDPDDSKSLRKLFYLSKQQSSTVLVSGNSPKWLHESIEDDYSSRFKAPIDFNNYVPKHWIKLKFDESESDKIFLSIDPVESSKIQNLYPINKPFTSSDSTGIFSISDDSIDLEFAAYIIDPLTGQFARIPGIIRFNLEESRIESVTPNGCIGGNPIKIDDSIDLEFKGENLSGAYELMVELGSGPKSILKKGDGSVFIPSLSGIQIISPSSLTWRSAIGSLGSFNIYLKTENTQNIETNKKTIIISENIVTADTLPDCGEIKLNLESLNSVYSPSIGIFRDKDKNKINSNGPDSIPYLMGGGSVSIDLKSKSNIFLQQNYNNLFAYIAFENKAVLENSTVNSEIFSIEINGKTFYSNKLVFWEYGSREFRAAERDRSAVIQFPGPMNSGPNNFRYLIEDHPSSPKEAYLIFSTNKFDKNVSTNDIIIGDYYSISVLKLGSQDRPAFIDPPNIVGVIAKTNDGKAYSNFDPSKVISSNSETDISYLIKNAIPIFMISSQITDDNLSNDKLTASKKIKDLFILFKGPNKPTKYYKGKYRFKIGFKDITRDLSRRIRYLKDGIAYAYFRNIKLDFLNGLSDIRIEVVNSNGSYNSDLYTKVTKKINSEDFKLEDKKIVIQNNSAKRLNTYDESLRPNIFSLPLPINKNEERFYYQKFGYRRETPGVAASNSGGIDPYIEFLSPIKIKPNNLNITFGNLDAKDDPTKPLYGCILFNSDGQESIIEVSQSSVKTIINKEDAVNKATRMLSEVKDKISSIKNRNQEASDPESASSQAVGVSITSGNDLVNLEALTSELNDLIADVNSTAAQIQEKIDLINAAFKRAASLADNLSSANFSLSDVVENLTDEELIALGKPTSIIKLNQFHVYFEDKINNVNYYIDSNDNSAYIFDIIKIENTNLIELNIPEIVSIKNLETPNIIYTVADFNKFKIGTDGSVNIEIRVRGGSKDTKIELAGYRIPTNFEKFESDIAIYTAKIKPQNMINIFVGDNCAKLTATNSNRLRVGAERVFDPLAGQDIDLYFGRLKNLADKAGKNKLDSIIEKTKLKVGPVIYDKSLTAKEFLKSICDLSFHLTAEISFQLKFLKILYIPIKVIFCIIDVICSLLHPVKLAFAVIRLFACLFDLLLLLPPIAMPILFLTLVLHILELLLCVIQKAVGLVVAINEVIEALDTAVRRKDIESIKNLEVTLNEHFLTIEADLQVLEPIFQILGLILELLQLAFAFPCQVVQDEDQPTCIDPSMLAGLILSKVAPNGQLVPDAMIPLAQDYTRLSVARTGENGNSPEVEGDNIKILDSDYREPPEDPRGNPIENVLFRISEAINNNKTTIILDNTNFAGNALPDLKDSQTNEPKVVEPGGFFSGDINGDGFIDNIDYEKMRFLSGEFDASFVISCTKSKKKFSLGIPLFKPKNDPRFVEFQFNSEGLTSEIALRLGGLGFLFKKKIVDELFTVDTPPAMLTKRDKKLLIQNSTSIDPENIRLISPIDGFSNFIEFAGFDGDDYTYRSRPLVADIEVYEPSVDPVTNEPVLTSRTVTKTFGGIPSFAIVDNKFNVYFLEENGLKIELQDVSGKKVPVIKSIFAKMINFPAAETQRTEKEERQQVRKTGSYEQKLIKSSIIKELLDYSAKDGDRNSNIWINGYRGELGDAILKMQANSAYIESLPAEVLEKISNFVNSQWVSIDTDTKIFGSSSPIALIGDPAGDPAIPYTIYINYNKINKELFLNDDRFTESGNDFVGINGATRLRNYILSAAGGEILSSEIEFPFPDYGVYDFANGTVLEFDDFQYAINIIDVLNFPQIYFVDMRQVADDISSACGTSQTNELLLDMPGFTLDFGKDVVGPYLECLNTFRDFFIGQKDGFITKARSDLASGNVPKVISYDIVKGAYDDIVACTNKAIDDSCKFVINPLNTTFKLIEDNDNTALPGFVDPSLTITEIVTDGAASTLPTITGAMEYASGSGDSAVVKAGGFATIQIIPRDSYDDIIVDSFDARRKINITIVSDETKTGAKLEKIDPKQELLWAKNGSVYAARITSDTPGKVTIKASICNVTIQAVTDRGIETTIVESGPDCIPNADEDTSINLFPPGALRKVDRILTILFTGNNIATIEDGGQSGDAMVAPQIPFTDMVN